MSKYTELSSYIASLQQRLRLGAWLRGAAIFTGTALTVTVVLVLVLNHLAFPTHGVAIARLAILVALAAAAIAGIALPVTALTRARAVHRAESANPELEQRLTTFEERSSKGDDPFLELLAADTLAHTENVAPATLVPDNQLFALGGAGLACLGVLAWMIAAGPGFLGYGASLIWTGAKKDAAPLYSISVTPGNVTVRRNSDQLITAHVTGMQPGKAQLFARYQSALGWEPVLMQAAPNSGAGASYQFVLAGLPENVEYYVEAGPLVSQHYKVRVVDLPTVKEIKVTLHYPKWTGMKPVVEEHSGDLRAIEGTDAAIEVQMDRPLKDGTLTLDDGQTIHLTGGAGNSYQGTIHMTKDGAYHVAATDEGQPVRLSEDYFIATDKAQPPQISISRPTGDYRASPIEEVTVGVKGSDEFGLTDMHLHYSVNGGPDKDVSLLKTPGVKEADGSYMLPLEDYKLVPGDLISIYATAKDGNSQAQTDISFIQVDPFEREFSQSQQSGGGGGGGGGGGQSGDQTEISKREKELIAATWKQQNDKTATPKDAAAQGQFLSDAQQKLRDQVNALSIRMQSRDVSSATEEFTEFDKDMQAASQAMGPSVDKLKATQWKDAMPLEQKALQALLRAEATFRQIEVAFGQQGGGGGGGGGSAGRDLASLFDLELDTAKNQYETAQTASPEQQHEKEVQDALDKLDALAKRQQDLANQPHDPQQSFQERWQQEMLRREAEQLQRQMEQLTRNGQQQNQQNNRDQQNQQSSNSQQQNSQQQSSQNNPGGQSSAQGQSGSSGSSSSGQGGGQQSGISAQSSSSGQSGIQPSQQGSNGKASQASASGKSSEQESSEQRIQEALNRLQQATDAMKRGGGSPQQETDAARQAADRLREATNLMAGTQQQLATGQVDQMAREAGRLAQQEHKQAGEIDQLAKAGQAASAKQGATSASDISNLESLLRQRDQIASERQQLSDDLSKLQQGMRDAARELAPDQPGVAKKLRDSLSDMDESELDNQVQRTADWLRSGINPNSNGTEAGIAQGLSKLSQQLQGAQQEAQKEGGPGKPGQERGAGQSDETAALDQVERLRSQLEAMARSQNGNGQPEQNGQNANGPNPNGQSRNGQYQSGQSQNGRNGQNQYGPNGQRFNPQTDMLSRNGYGQQQGQNGQQSSQNPGGQNGQFGQQQDRQNGQNGSQQGGQNQAGQQAGQQGGQQGGGNRGGQQQAGNGARNGGNGNRNGGNQNGGYSGDTRAGGGGYRDGTVWGNYDTGGNTPTARGNRQPAPTDASGNPADTERTFDQSMRELNQLKQMVQDDPQAAKEVSELTQKMQHLDPSRFPGNPAMVEQMHNEVLSSVDKLELELQRQDAATDARTGKPNPIPAGYQESVADYYRRLSKNQ